MRQPLENETTKKRKYVESLARGFEVLQSFSTGEQYLGNKELAEITGLPNATITRLTFTLSELGYLNYSRKRHKYTLDSSILGLGYLYLANLHIQRIAKPIMEKLHTETKLSIGLSTIDRRNLCMIVLENSYGSDSQAIRLEVGSRSPITTSAVGRAYLAQISEEKRKSLLSEIEQKSPNRDWKKERKLIAENIALYEERGFCSSLGDWDRTINACAVAITIRDESVMTLNAAAPAYILSEETIMSETGFRLIHAARDLSTNLGRSFG